ncbi:MAG: FeoA domain-containing protein, partial [Oscillospiraceae bacterium]|nr:FeoA domain-containing protein [Oscillospiraceae bacterium]
MTLKDIKEGQSARVLSVGGSGALLQHLLDMGIIPGTDIRVVKSAPMGYPVEI